MFDLSAPNQLILIGPSGVGKTTIGTRIAVELGYPFTSLDTVEREYILSAGYDLTYAETLKRSPIPFARYQYRRTFFDVAVDRFLQDNHEGVLEFGAGHPIVPDMSKQARIIELLSPYPHVILLLPTPDLQESIQLIRERMGWDSRLPDINELFITDDTYLKLAKHVIYTERKTPEVLCEEITRLVSKP